MEKVEKAGTHVIFENKEVAAWVIHTQPQLKYKAGALHIIMMTLIGPISILEISSLIPQQKYDKVCLFVDKLMFSILLQSLLPWMGFQQNISLEGKCGHSYFTFGTG